MRVERATSSAGHPACSKQAVRGETTHRKDGQHRNAGGVASGQLKTQPTAEAGNGLVSVGRSCVRNDIEAGNGAPRRPKCQPCGRRTKAHSDGSLSLQSVVNNNRQAPLINDVCTQSGRKSQFPALTLEARRAGVRRPALELGWACAPGAHMPPSSTHLTVLAAHGSRRNHDQE